jgi:hypothetical protein
MKFRKTKCLAKIILCCGAVSFTASADKFEQRLGKKYFLKHNLILFNSPPKIFPDNIIFADGCNDVRTGSELIIHKGIEVEIASMERVDKFLKLTLKPQDKFLKLALQTQKDSFQVLLANRFERSFDLAFAEKWEEKKTDGGCVGDYTTKLQVIKCIGFPIFACKKGRTERLFYTLEFAGSANYDTWWIEIKDGKVVNVTGTI